MSVYFNLTARFDRDGVRDGEAHLTSSIVPLEEGDEVRDLDPRAFHKGSIGPVHYFSDAWREQGRRPIRSRLEGIGVIYPPILKYSVRPSFRRGVIRKNDGKTLTVLFIVNREGLVEGQPEIIENNGTKHLEGPTIEAVKQWVFLPAVVEATSEAIRVWTTVTIEG